MLHFSFEPCSPPAKELGAETVNDHPSPCTKLACHNFHTSSSHKGLIEPVELVESQPDRGYFSGIGEDASSTSMFTAFDNSEMKAKIDPVCKSEPLLPNVYDNVLELDRFPQSNITNGPDLSKNERKKRQFPDEALDLKCSKSKACHSLKQRETNPVKKRQNRKFKLDIPGDGFKWRKYGQKNLIDTPFMRTYFACTFKQEGCSAKKTVDRHSTNSNLLRISYEGKHNHPPLVIVPREDFSPNLVQIPNVTSPHLLPNLNISPAFSSTENEQMTIQRKQISKPTSSFEHPHTKPISEQYYPIWKGENRLGMSSEPRYNVTDQNSFAPFLHFHGNFPASQTFSFVPQNQSLSSGSSTPNEIPNQDFLSNNAMVSYDSNKHGGQAGG